MILKSVLRVVQKIQRGNDVTMFWISFCGTQKEAEWYEYTLKIQSETQNMVTKCPFPRQRIVGKCCQRKQWPVLLFSCDKEKVICPSLLKNLRTVYAYNKNKCHTNSKFKDSKKSILLLQFFLKKCDRFYISESQKGLIPEVTKTNESEG